MALIEYLGIILPRYLQSMSIPELPERRIGISDAARTSSITYFRTAILDNDLIDGIVEYFFDVFDIFGCKADPVVVAASTVMVVVVLRFLFLSGKVTS